MQLKTLFSVSALTAALLFVGACSQDGASDATPAATGNDTAIYWWAIFSPFLQIVTRLQNLVNDFHCFARNIL